MHMPATPGSTRRAGTDLHGAMRLALCYLAFGHACFIAALAMLAWRWRFERERSVG